MRFSGDPSAYLIATTMTPTRHILMVGNGSYRNHGCEAIVRGTATILRAAYGQELGFNVGVYDTPATIDEQNRTEVDRNVMSHSLCPPMPRWSPAWWEMKCNRYLHTSLRAQHRPLAPLLGMATVALEIGGDNYSLDYGIPRSFMDMDRYIMSRGVPVVIWGASVGPFDRNPAFAEEMFRHLRSLKAIFARESDTVTYLAAHGVAKNVHLVADPAFVMEAAAPSHCQPSSALPDKYVGVNFSPLIARYYQQDKPTSDGPTEAQMERWLTFCVGALRELRRTLDMPVVLIPHVESINPANDDLSFLAEVSRRLSKCGVSDMITVGGRLHATELKSIIAGAHLFAGARTHSTIASMSSCVPTLSLGYSLKARGINVDVFGHDRFCVDTRKLTVDVFVEQMLALNSNWDTIRKQLQEQIPKIQQRALSAGSLLRQLVPDGNASAYAF